MAKSVIREKSYHFALEIFELFKELQAGNEYILSKQLLRSGTRIGANIEETLAGQNPKDFLAKTAIASKEVRETRYWLALLQESHLAKMELDPAISHTDKLIRILTSIVKTTAENPVIQNSRLKTQN